MTGAHLLEVTAGVGLLVLGLVRIGLSGGALHRPQSVRLRCPKTGGTADCRIVQDVRTGQWKDVHRCSELPDLETITCDRECTQAMNLGLRLP